MNVSGQIADPHNFPELVFGLVGPVGVDLHIVSGTLTEALLQVGYTCEAVRLSKLMNDLPGEPWKDLPTGGPYDESLSAYMSAGDKIREVADCGDALALLAVGAIREIREARAGEPGRALSRVAYVLHSLKRPEEVETLRRIYGPTFFLVSAYAPRDKRVQYLAKRIAESRYKHQAAEFVSKAEDLVGRDEAEGGRKYGQNVQDTFPLSDVIVNTEDAGSLKASISRFTDLIFGNPFHTPSPDEQGVAHAYLAALRSSSLARQVGAALCRSDGSLIATGANDVAKSGGGLYWAGDEGDGRDFQGTRDSSDKMRESVLADILKNLQDAGWLSEEQQSKPVGQLVQSCLYSTHSPTGVERPIMKGALFLRTIDYVRAVHAEMAALTDAARNGVSVKGAVLYTTTFPCHDCAKHLVAAGVERVVYVEPYPKSLVQELYPDSVMVDSGSECGGKVRFEPFVGVAPKRYRELFSAIRKTRKKPNGEVFVWRPTGAAPHLPEYLPSPLTRLTAEQEELNRFRQLLVEKGLANVQGGSGNDA
ncbi:MAG: anti-phage dCTP deaminase [Paludibaculum sp.]